MNAQTMAKSLVALLILAAAGCGGGGTTVTPHPTTMPTTAPLSQALWVANGTNVLEILPSQLTAGVNASAPHLTLNSATGFGAPQGVVFDTAGDLFVVDGGTMAAGGNVPPAIDEFSPAQLAALGTTPNPTPFMTITIPGFRFPQQAVFDKNGNLWVSDNGANAVFEFSQPQLVGVLGNMLPNATITSSPAFTGPLGIAFAPNGNLWIANNGGTSLFEFDAGALPTAMAASVTLTPHVVLSDNGNKSIQAPWALVFDKAGNLWSSNANAPFTVVEFAAANLNASGAPNPGITLSPTTVGGNPTLNAPNGLAFDNLGNLSAVNSAGAFGVPVYRGNQLTAGGAIVPNIFLVGGATTFNAPAGDVFGPII
ncbi:MAG: hypothetical protein M3R53_00455 [Candidatus Eremiobacteraeota bacterium]|nr:hypothetical protein [Candidatus Eremiobacteraeota bacterium]